jgi:hypothetical protein
MTNITEATERLARKARNSVDFTPCHMQSDGIRSALSIDQKTEKDGQRILVQTERHFSQWMLMDKGKMQSC